MARLAGQASTPAPPTRHPSDSYDGGGPDEAEVFLLQLLLEVLLQGR